MSALSKLALKLSMKLPLESRPSSGNLSGDYNVEENEPTASIIDMYPEIESADSLMYVGNRVKDDMHFTVEQLKSNLREFSKSINFSDFNDAEEYVANLSVLIEVLKKKLKAARK